MKTKQLTQLAHLCEEGVAQLFTRVKIQEKLLALLGYYSLKLYYTLENEYKAKCRFETLNFAKAVWIGRQKRFR